MVDYTDQCEFIDSLVITEQFFGVLLLLRILEIMIVIWINTWIQSIKNNCDLYLSHNDLHKFCEIAKTNDFKTKLTSFLNQTISQDGFIQNNNQELDSTF